MKIEYVVYAISNDSAERMLDDGGKREKVRFDNVEDALSKKREIETEYKRDRLLFAMYDIVVEVEEMS